MPLLSRTAASGRLLNLAYHQPATRERASNIVGRYIGRDPVATLKRLALLEGGPWMPELGTPLTHTTTPAFLETVRMESMREQPKTAAVK